MLCRALFAIAAVGLVGGLVVGALPIEVHPVDAPPGVRREKVSCGTAFSDTGSSGDEACEGRRIGQAGLALMGFALCVVSFVLGAGALVLSMHRELRYGRV